jgi:hypothetical protein
MGTLTRFALKTPVLNTFCFVILLPNMLITNRYSFPPSQVMLSQVMGAKLQEPSSLFVPMMNAGWTHME